MSEINSDNRRDVENQMGTPNNSRSSSPFIKASNTQSPTSCYDKFSRIMGVILLALASPLVLPYAILSICLTGHVLKPNKLKEHPSPNISNNGSDAARFKYKACLMRCVRAYGYVLLCACVITVFIMVFPFLLAHSILSLCFTGKFDFTNELSLKIKKPKNSTNDDLYRKIFESKPMNFKLKHLNTIATVRLGLLSLSWLVVNLCVPSLRRKTLFGSLLWKWSLFVVVLLLGHFSAIFTICVPFELLTNAGVLQGKHRLEYFIRGLQYNVAMLFYFVIVICAWEFYFQTDHGLNPNPKPGGIDMFCTRALWCSLVGTALWVLKTAVLLHWKAKAILERFKDRIVDAGIPLFFLICIKIRLDHEDNDDDKDKDKDKEPFPLPWGYEIQNKKKDVALLQIEEVARPLQCFAAETLRDDNATATILQKFQGRVRSENEGGPNISKEWLADMFKLGQDDALLLIKKVRPKKEEVGVKKEEVRPENLSDQKITCETFSKWMVDAHKNCLSLGYTLNDAFAMVSVLDMVLRCFIVAVVTLSWLIVTGLAATKVLITIGTIFVSLTFMFGDTCKAFFQGVIFSFVTHPFDIGDRCIIDGVEVEVKSIGILTTTCLKIGTEEKMLYPNSNLSTQLIINLEAKPDPTDSIELLVDSSTTSDQIKGLRKKIQDFFGNPGARGPFDEKHKVTVKEVENSIKITIQFNHILNAEDVTHSKCFEKKSSQQYDFYVKMKKLLEEIKATETEATKIKATATKATTQ